MRRHWLIGVTLLAAACSSNAEGEPTTPPPLPSTSSAALGEPRELAKNLSIPWAIDFLPNKEALVTERESARLLRVTPQGQVTPIGRVPGVQPGGEGGLMGVAVSPTYAEDHLIYLHFTAADDNRVVRFRLDDALTAPHPIVTGIPKGGNHNGGRIAFGPDKYLYIATGETGEPERAQNRDDLGGKILRVTPDGKPAPGNPFNTRIWSWGHRNVQGLAWDDAKNLYATEFGQNRYDEINLITKGANYGWPDVEGTSDDEKFTNPLLTWATSEASPSGLAYANGSLWAAGLRGERLWQVPVQDGKAGKPVPHLENRYGRLRAAVRAPDGTLWITTSNKDGRGDPKPDDDKIIVLPLK
ncbi:PQQ-dependent sugar dehydrogenase [Actinomadura hibisca]|uniref:PQQ-dependent sugar dehydrogenase n=1 Tax=Actinomadura hibisca TaxID=68565 RepID=UPI00082FA80C|nr:PQQ-dependent sugar dehydrogenase [Actinomadura hibisca]